MRRLAWLSPVAALALGVCFLAVARARDDTEKEKIAAALKAEPDAEKLADAAGNPDALKKQAEAIIKKYDEMLPIMWQMKPSDKGGMQIGKPGTLERDSIELGLLKLGSKKGAPTAKDLADKDKAKDLQRMADVIRGIAEITPAYGPKFTKNKDEEKLWNQLADGMKQSSDDLRAAIKAGDDKAFVKAANQLNKNCNDCHTKFRDTN
jgi:hypothetical protein